MSRNKKIIIGVVVVLLLGAIAFANFKFKRSDGLEVTTEAIKKRHLEAIVSASGKIQPKRDVNISADTMGRVTDLAVDEGDRVTKGQFLLQIDPRNLRTAVQRTEASLAAGALAGRAAADRRSRAPRSRSSRREDNYTRQQNLWKGGLTTRETLERAENDLKAAAGGPPRAGAVRSGRRSCAWSPRARRPRARASISARCGSNRRSPAS